jgi:putative thioredoxin
VIGPLCPRFGIARHDVRAQRLIRLVLIVFIGALPPAATRADDQDRIKPWLESYEAALEQARHQRQPVLMRAGATWCSWCRKLDVEFGKPEIQAELKAWTIAHIDIDKAPDDARRLGVGPVPALRAITATGRIVGRHDGYLPAEQLLAWL